MEDWNGLAKIAGFTNEESMLHYMYVKEQLPIGEIARKLGVGPATIAHRLDKCKIEKRTRGGANNSIRVSKMLHRMDQRIVFGMKDTLLAVLVNAHPSTVYKYKRMVKANFKPWTERTA